MEGMELTELVYAGEMQDTLYELVKIEMKKDRFLSDQEKSVNFEEWALSRKGLSLWYDTLYLIFIRYQRNIALDPPMMTIIPTIP